MQRQRSVMSLSRILKRLFLIYLAERGQIEKKQLNQ